MQARMRLTGSRIRHLLLNIFASAAVAGCSAASEAAPDPLDSARNAEFARSAVPLELTLASTDAAPNVVTDAEVETKPAATARTDFEYSGELTQGGFIRGFVPSDTIRATLGNAPLKFAEDGSFFAAFDRDSPDSMSLLATRATGGFARRELKISAREWSIQRVNIARRAGGPSAAYWARRKPELDEINAARAERTGAEGWRQDFIWPVKGRISGKFGRQRIYRGEPGSYHSGIDIAPGAGKPFVAPADGVVVLARQGFSLEGGLIIIDHGLGLNSAFLHASKIAVKPGDAVKQGQYIGNVGASGRATGPHLHWSLKWKDARLDPLLFTGPMP